MKLFQRIFFAVLLAGLISGAVLAAIQAWRVTPLILAAEVYEDADPVAAAEAASNMDAAMAMPEHHHDAAAGDWKPTDGLERTGLTVLADILTALGFAFILAAVSVLTGIPVTAANGVIWGLCGYLTFQLLPAFGLPPELPGMPAADLGARQIWWWATALATATALFGIAKFRSWPAGAIGAVLLLLPHVIGAPQTPEAASGVPAGLASSFAASALTASAAFWLVLGPAYGWLSERLARATEPQTKRVLA